MKRSCNLTKAEFLYLRYLLRAKTAERRGGYIAYIDELYNASGSPGRTCETCSIIGANILNIARQDYMNGRQRAILVTKANGRLSIKPGIGPLPAGNRGAHLDRAAICVHTYPEAIRKAGYAPFAPTSKCVNLRGDFTAKSAPVH